MKLEIGGVYGTSFATVGLGLQPSKGDETRQSTTFDPGYAAEPYHNLVSGRLHTLSKRAPSTTRHLSVFRINDLRLPQPQSSQNCVRPPDLLQSLTATRAVRRRDRCVAATSSKTSVLRGHSIITGHALGFVVATGFSVIG